MDEFANYPLAPFVNALRTVIGRAFLGFFAVVVGVFLGGATGSQSLAGGLAALTEFPSLLVASLFVGYGILVIPLVLFFIILFARSEWPLWVVVIATVLWWWSIHLTVHFALHNSPMARIEKELRQSVAEASRQVAEARQKEAQQPVEKPKDRQ